MKKAFENIKKFEEGATRLSFREMFGKEKGDKAWLLYTDPKKCDYTLSRLYTSLNDEDKQLLLTKL